MRFKNYINESRSKVIDPKDVIKIIKSKCKKALKSYKKGDIIYRGINDNYKFLSIDPKKHTRESANTMNYYTLINDNSPAWKKYPKRSQSLICTTDMFTASNYGYEYVVLPYDGAKIGVAPMEDYWFSFDNITGIDSLDSFNYQLERLFKQINIPLSDASYSKIQRAFNDFDIIFGYDDESLNILIDDNFSILDGYDDYNDMMEFIQETLDPDNNGFRLITIGDKLPNGDNELWTDSKCILINVNISDEILENL